MSRRTKAERLIEQQERALRAAERAERRVERERKAALRAAKRERRERRIAESAKADATMRAVVAGADVVYCEGCKTVKFASSFYSIDDHGCGVCYACTYADVLDHGGLIFPPAIPDSILDPIIAEGRRKAEVTK